MTDYKIDTILAHTGINSDERTGALISLSTFRRPINTLSLVNRQVMTTREQKSDTCQSRDDFGSY